MLKIEVFPENVMIDARIIQSGDKPPRTIYEQTAYVHLGGKFPVEMKVSLEKDQVAYAAGLYTMHSSSFIVNNFGGLELKKYGKVLEPLDADF